MRNAMLALSLFGTTILSAPTAQALGAPYVEVVYDLGDSTFSALGAPVVPVSFSGSVTIDFTSDGAGIIEGPGELVDFTILIEDFTVPSFGLAIDALIDQAQTNVTTGILAGSALTSGAGQTIEVEGATGSGIFGCTPVQLCAGLGLDGPFPIDLSGPRSYPVGGSALLFTDLDGTSSFTGSLVLPIGDVSANVALVGTEISRQIVPEPGQGLLAITGAAALALLRHKHS